MFGLFHAAWTIARSPVHGTKEVMLGLRFVRLRRDVLLAAAMLLVSVCGMAALRRCEPNPPTVTAMTTKPPFWWEWIRNRWPLRTSDRTVAASGA